MRVLHIAESTCGGVGSYLEEVAEFQTDRLGAENVRFLVPSEPNSPFRRSHRESQVTTFSRDHRCMKSLASLTQISARETHRFRPTIVHLHSTFAGAVVRPWIKLSRQLVKTVYCPHGWSFGMDISKNKQSAYATLERTLCRTTDLVVLNSESERRLAQQFGVTSQKMIVIPNGVAEHQAPAGYVRPTRSGRLRLGFVGRFDPQKGLDILLSSFGAAARPDLELHVIGAEVASDNMKVSLLQQQNVFQYGWLPRDKVYALVAGLDALVMPSRWEAMPLVAMEAMQLGVPVIGSDRGGIPEIIRHNRDGLIFSLDEPNALADILQRVTREQLDKFGASARVRYLDSFTADKMNNDVLAAYQVLEQSTAISVPQQPVLEQG